MWLAVFAKGTLRHHPGLLLRQVIDRRGHVTSRWKRLYDQSVPGLPTSTSANIRRGQAAMAHVIQHQETAHQAMHRQDIGWIDFVWGAVGAPATKVGKRKGAHGVAHILEARQRKDGMTVLGAQKLAMSLPEVIARGRVMRADRFGDQGRMVLDYGGHEAILIKPRKSPAWLLSGWQKQPPVA